MVASSAHSVGAPTQCPPPIVDNVIMQNIMDCLHKKIQKETVLVSQDYNYATETLTDSYRAVYTCSDCNLDITDEVLNHDCKMSPEDGCEICNIIFDED